MNDYSYLESLPVETIVTQILPELSAIDLIRLCGSSNKFREICSDSYIWQKRIKEEIPHICIYNPTFRDYIQFITNRIPVILNGDVIAHTTVDFSRHRLGLELVFSDLANILTTGTYTLIFLSGLEPIYALDTRNVTYAFTTRLYVTKLLLVPDMTLQQLITLPSLIEYSTPGYLRRIKEDNTKAINKIIDDNLFSPLSSTPIYGIYRSQSGLEILDLRTKRGWIYCNSLNRDELMEILTFLGYRGDTNIRGKDHLCDLIRNRLEDIGHYVRI